MSSRPLRSFDPEKMCSLSLARSLSPRRHDTELTDLIPFLADLGTVDDVRSVLDANLYPPTLVTEESTTTTTTTGNETDGITAALQQL